jgi:F-type H+-transporting ATPase subunit gamma
MNVRQVKRKIKSIGNVKKITKAMEMVSAIKMRKAQQVEIEGRPYWTHLDLIMKRIIPGADATTSPLLSISKKIKSNKNLVICITSNKGLCGSYNINLLRFLIKNIDIKNCDFITIGKKGSQFLARTKTTVIADFSDAAPLGEVTAIANLALEKYLLGEYTKVVLIYTKFISTLKSEPLVETLVPVEYKQEDQTDTKLLVNYLVEPSEEEIIDFLLQSYVEDKIRSAIISGEAVEHSARMIAMKNATDNANEVIYNFTLLGNKLRQEKITNELLDMVTAKESVEAS